MVEQLVYQLIFSLETPRELQMPLPVLQVTMPVQYYRDCVLLFTLLHITLR